MKAQVERWVDRHFKWVLMAPAVVFVVALVIYPLGFTLNLSFTDAARATNRPFEHIGLANFTELLSDTTRFWPAVGRTAYFTVIAVAIQMLLGILIALVLRKPFRGEGMVRVAILLPLVATPVAIGMMWMLIFEPNFGVANYFLEFLGLPAQGWLSSQGQALNTLIFIDTWQWTPMVALIVLAGLTAIPEETEEAAEVDGATGIQKLWFVILPQALPSIVAALMIRSIDAMKTFDILYATKGAGGGSNHEAETLNVLAYSYSFDYQQYGLASAVLIFFLITILAVVLTVFLLRKKVTSR